MRKSPFLHITYRSKTTGVEYVFDIFSTDEGDGFYAESHVARGNIKVTAVPERLLPEIEISVAAFEKAVAATGR